MSPGQPSFIVVSTVSNGLPEQHNQAMAGDIVKEEAQVRRDMVASKVDLLHDGRLTSIVQPARRNCQLVLVAVKSSDAWTGMPTQFVTGHLAAAEIAIGVTLGLARSEAERRKGEARQKRTALSSHPTLF